MFKLNHKDTRTTTMVSFQCLNINFEHISHLVLVFLLFLLLKCICRLGKNLEKVKFNFCSFKERNFYWGQINQAVLLGKSTNSMLLESIDLERSSHKKCSVKKVFFKISQNSQESTCARVSFLITLQA